MSLLTVEEQFATHCLADPTVTGYLATRLYDTKIPAGAVFPCAVYERISTNRLYTHGAPDNGNIFHGNDSNSGRTRFQVTVYSDISPNQARQVAQAFIVALTTFNAWDGSNRGPNQIVNQRGGVKPNTQPPLPYQRFDVLIPFADNT